MNWPKPNASQPFDGRNDQSAVAVLAGEIDGQTQVYVGGGDGDWFTVHFGEVAVHIREILDGLDDGVAQ